MSEPHRSRSFRLGLLGATFAILTMCLSAAPAISQVLYGSITGVVKDAQGADGPWRDRYHRQQGNQPHA